MSDECVGWDAGPPAYISFDAGTSLYGIGRALGPAKSREAARSSSLSGAPALTNAGAIFRDSIKVGLQIFLISSLNFSEYSRSCLVIIIRRTCSRTLTWITWQAS